MKLNGNQLNEFGYGMNKAVFLDRDGILCDAIVVNKKPCSARSMSQLTIWPETIKACQELKDAGFLLVCFSNQPDIARGFVTKEQIEEQNNLIKIFCKLDYITYCPHDDSDNCECRKPKPGMILEAAKKLDIDLSQSYGIGDRWRDIEAMQNAGVYPIFIDYGYDEKVPLLVTFYGHFTQAVNHIVLRDVYNFIKEKNNEIRKLHN